MNRAMIWRESICRNGFRCPVCGAQPTVMLVRDADRPGGYRCGACGLTAAVETEYDGPEK